MQYLAFSSTFFPFVCDWWWGPSLPPKVPKFVLIKKVVDSKLFPPNAGARGGISWRPVHAQCASEFDIRENFDTIECPNIFVSS